MTAFYIALCALSWPYLDSIYLLLSFGYSSSSSSSSQQASKTTVASMMAFSSLTSIPLSSSSSLYAPSISSPFRAFPQSNFHLKNNNNYSNFSLKAQTLDFTGSFFEGGLGSDDDDDDDDDIVLPGTGFADLEEREEPQCPPGLRPYETMVVLRPDMSEDERLALTQKYEEVQFSPFSTSFYVFLFDKF
jgi:hypothetical protein